MRQIQRISHRSPAVASRVRHLIGEFIPTSALRDLLLHIMSRSGRVLSPRGPARWPALVRETARALGAAGNGWVVAGAAVELAVAGIDVADDLIDREWDEADGPWGRGLNASQSLSWLAQLGILDAVPSIGTERTLLLSHLLAEGAAGCCGGQDMDLLLETSTDVTEESSHEMTRLKSGSLVSMACQVGASLATGDPVVVRLVGALGEHIGTIEQLLNDAADLVYTGSPMKSDLLLGKRTLPVAYALHCAREEGLVELMELFGAAGPPTPEQERRLAAAVRELGGLQYAMVVAEAHRERALRTVEEVIQLTGLESASHLRRLIPRLGRRTTGGRQRLATGR